MDREYKNKGIIILTFYIKNSIITKKEMKVMMNSTHDDFDDFLGRLIIDYYTLYSEMPEVNFEIVITDDLCRKHLELRPDMKAELLKEGIENDNDYNGRMVLPKHIGDTISILLNKQKIVQYTNDKSYTWIGTFAHELTHAIDYSMMALMEELTAYDPLLRRENYLIFQLWSEYHAKRLGYNFLRYELKVDCDTNTTNERIDNIINRELPFHMENFYNEYHSTANGNQQLYWTMQIVGRFSVWCDLFPDIFNDKFLRNVFKECIWLYNILNFLKQYKSLDCIYPHFDDMRLILKENWVWL